MLMWLGALAGAQKDKAKTSSGIDVGQASALERQGSSAVGGAFGQLQAFANAGPGQQDVSNSVNASRDLATLLQQMQASGGMPGQEDVNTANTTAANLFQARQLQLQQAFGDQTTQANRQAALMGRSTNDPILRAKLAQEQTRQQALLGAEQGAAAQQLALQLPGQRLQYASSRAEVLGGLAQQAMANRQAILALGSGIQEQERTWRLNTGTRWGTQESGGGLKGAVSGGLAALGAGMSAAGSLMGMGGFGGAGGGLGGGLSMPSLGQSAGIGQGARNFSLLGGAQLASSPSFAAPAPAAPSLSYGRDIYSTNRGINPFSLY
jgi:hypothetical protein